MKMVTEIWNSNIEHNEYNTYKCNEIKVQNLKIILGMNHEVWILIYQRVFMMMKIIVEQEMKSYSWESVESSECHNHAW